LQLILLFKNCFYICNIKQLLKPICMKKITILIVSVLSLSLLYAQPSIQWQKSFGGTASDGAFDGFQTADGGYVVAGRSTSNDGDVIGHHGPNTVIDIWVIKLDSNGIMQWQKSLGGYYMDVIAAIDQTSDGGYMVAGWTDSNDGDVTGNHGGSDYWLVKLDASGNIQWQKTYGGSGHESSYGAQQTSDGGYVIAGRTSSTDGDVTGFHGGSDFWVVKTDSAGTLQWAKCYGGTNGEVAHSIRQTTDGGYIVAGETGSTDGDVTGPHGSTDSWVIKLDANGILQWQRCLGGAGIDIAYSVVQTSGGYVVAVATGSTDGDVIYSPMVGPNYWIVKLNNAGVIQWQKVLGGGGFDIPYSVENDSDGGCIVGGYSSSSNFDITSYHGSNDIWLIKLDSNGVKQWQKCYGGTNNDAGHSTKPTNDNGYIVLSECKSNDGDISGNHGDFDFWVAKLSPLNCLASFSLYPDSLTQHLYWAINQSYGIPPIHYDWNWGDGSPHDTIEFPSHIYANGGWFTICLSITDSSGCSSSQCFNHFLARMETTNTMVYVNVVATIPTAIPLTNSSDIYLFPNPSSDKFIITTSQQLNSLLQIFNPLGEKIMEQNISSPKTEINLSNHPNGIYFVQLKTDEGVVTRKIILSK
jgi:hypothetical protein